MASTATPDVPITLKINYDGLTRRYKLPLRDLGVNTLEGKLRTLLSIPQDANPTFERYSDSAAAYVVLDTSNISVYKQLYRAAKAKQKLKLRVTSQSESQTQQEGITGPKPVTVEDVPDYPDVKSTVTTEPPIQKIILTVNAPQVADDFPIFIEQWLELGLPRLNVRRNADGVEVVDFFESTSQANIEESTVPMPADYQFTKAASQLSFVSLVHQAQQKRKSEVKSDSTEPTQQATDKMKEHMSQANFTVCCNSCDRAVPDAHFHCSTCDDGDFDLCQECVNQGITCYNENHWLIKRTVKDGQITYSTTHVVPKVNRPVEAPKKRSVFPQQPIDQILEKLRAQHESLPLLPKLAAPAPLVSWTSPALRTCNSCVAELPEHEFLHCTNCEDFDLCSQCFSNDLHGHHPGHGFEPAVKNTAPLNGITSRLGPGRNVPHNAICDGCDKYIRGVRHKCLDCPDWDYCADCILNADFIHKGHRFVPIYEPISLASRVPGSPSRVPSVHVGICCDGPLCTPSRRSTSYIIGDRYKCAVCHDTDFCANCEASPANKHNKTHPLIKFKTPVRHVTVSTQGEHGNGQRLPPMGDRCTRAATSHRATETTPSPKMSVNSVQTVVDVKPTETEGLVKKEIDDIIKQEPVEEKKPFSADDLVANFQHDTVPDGSILPPNHTFNQTWVLRNDGEISWPAGSSVKFVGGDYMGAVDPNHPAGISELTSASESTVCGSAVAPGESIAFTVQMRTPARPGKVISYWRLTTQDGIKFGHRLWCDVNVADNTPKEVREVKKEQKDDEKLLPETIKSQMIIPKLEHESPEASIHETNEDAETETRTETDTIAPSAHGTEVGEFEDCSVDEAWADDSDDGFMTDEEYDILDASDEEFLYDQEQKASK